jgi:ABC-type antimicrobial peptide transport system permease subunit
MIKNYFLVAWRNLSRNKMISILNVSGLALGLVSGLFILLWVQDERAVDGFHRNGRLLYAVYEREFYDHKVTADYETSGLMPQEMRRVIPEVEYATGMEEYQDKRTLQVGDKKLKWNGDAGSADFFTMFSYPLLQGTPSSALASPDAIAISTKMAEAFFGSPEAAMGKSIRYENQHNFMVTAVFDNMAHSSSRQFDFVLSWQYFMAHTGVGNWGMSGPYTILMLRPDANPALVEKKITRFLDNYLKDRQSGYDIQLGLQKYTDIYLHNHFTNGQPDGGRIDYVHLFSIVAIFILVIACINFMNLATARSAKRAKEIGVRKVVGALRASLIRQFMTESYLITLLAIAVALLLLVLLLPAFNSLTGKQISIPFSSAGFWMMLLLLTAATGFVAGSYPALLLSSFKPISVLKGTLRLGSNGRWLRKGLVVFQFTLSVMLIIGTIVVSRQVDFIQSRNIGYDKDNLIYIGMEGDLQSKYNVLKNEAGKMPGIASISFLSDDPDFMDDNTSDLSWPGKGPDAYITATQAAVTYDFVRTMKLTLVAGRDFSPDFPSDSLGYLINETAAREMGYTDPVGKSLTMWGNKGHIIGVLKDFNFTSVHERIRPLVLYRVLRPRPSGTLLVRTQPGQTRQALATMESLCHQLNPGFPFDFQFSDAAYMALYKSEQVIRRLSDIFAFLAIVICCLGLLGLATFTAEQRTKEIGIRKVLGASVPGLFMLLSKEFLMLSGLALLIAAPLAWYAMDKWLDNYAYRIDIAWWVFALAGGIAFVITLMAVGFQSAKVAVGNPVRSLRSE